MSGISDAIEKAVQDSMSDEGCLMTGFISLITYIDKDGEKMYKIARGSNQGLTNNLGMAQTLTLCMKHEVALSIRE